ncbi:regulator of Ty1 Transposition [Savitreella phatthalungensis]
MSADDVAIFENIKVSLDIHVPRGLHEKLVSRGAICLGVEDVTSYLEDNQHTSAVHFITSTFNSPASLQLRTSASQAVKRVIWVHPDWVEHSIVRGRLQGPERFSPDPRMFFTGVSVTCSGLPVGDKEAIYGGVLARGGRYSDSLTRGTTHVVALSTESEKCRTSLRLQEEHKAKEAKDVVQIVLPHWIDDCLQVGRRLPSEPYRLPNPSIAMTGFPDQNLSHRRATDDFTYLSSKRTKLSDVDVQSVKHDQVFTNYRFLFATDLDLETRIIESLKGIVQAAGGSIAKSFEDDANVYICQYRDGAAYEEAERRKLIVGNVAWTHWCVARGRFCMPRDHLLHYPIPKYGVPGFENFHITLSNYTGSARVYLEQLVVGLGANFTRSMSDTNTHLVTALEYGAKYDRADELDVQVVSHIWLEECFANWRHEPESRKKYTTWPRGTNLMDVVGTAQLDPKGLERSLRNGDEKANEPDAVAPIAVPDSEDAGSDSTVDAAEGFVHAAPLDTELPPTSDGQGGDVAVRQPTIEQSAADGSLPELEQVVAGRIEHPEPDELTIDHAEPEAPQITPAVATAQTQTQTQPSRGRRRSSVASASTAGRGTSVRRSSRATSASRSASLASRVGNDKDIDAASVISARNPIGTPATPQAGQPQTPVAGGRGSTARKSKSVASAKLKENMDDMNAWQKESKRKNPGFLPVRAATEISHTLQERRKRDVGVEVVVKTPAGKRRKSGVDGVRACLTSCKTPSQKMVDSLGKIGIELVPDIQTATHLVAPWVARTMKVLVGLAKADMQFVTYSWLEACNKAGKMLPESDFQLTLPDKGARESGWQSAFVIDEVLRRAKIHHDAGGLFHNTVVLASDAVAKDKTTKFGDVREVIVANGGDLKPCPKKQLAKLIADALTQSSTTPDQDLTPQQQQQQQQIIFLLKDNSDPLADEIERHLAEHPKDVVDQQEILSIRTREWLMQSVMLQDLLDDELL